MAQVPYQPFPTAQPTSPGERIAVNTPPAAFGENIGAAISHLGTTEDQVGGELFQRAIALQDLANENTAREAIADYMGKQGTLHADYTTTTGKDAKDGLQPYIDNSKDLLNQTANSISSPMARKMFLDNATSFLGRNIFNAAGHAATENKRYTIDTLNAQTNLDINATSDNPDDDRFVASQRDKITSDTTQAAMLKFGVDDPNDPNVKNEVQTTLSRQRTEQILGKARTDPIAAEQMFEKFGGDLIPADRDRAQGVIESKGAAVGGINIANQVFNSHRQSDGTYDVTTRQMQDEVRQKAAEVMPDNKLLPDVAVGKLDGLVNQDRYSKTRDTADAKAGVYDAIAKNKITDVQQLLALPGMDKVVEKLPPKDRNDLQGYINRYNTSANYVTDQNSLTMLNGLRNNDSAAFMAIDPTNPQYHLSQAHVRQIQDWQAQMAQKPYDDPRVSRALTWIKGARDTELQAMGIAMRDKSNPDDYDHFTGALQEALQIWQEDHNNKPPSYEEVVDKIGPQIIKTQATSKGFLGLWNNSGPAFQQFERPTAEDIPEDFRSKVTQEVVSKGGVAPTDQQLVQAYARTQFQKLYGGSASKPQPNAPQPPQIND